MSTEPPMPWWKTSLLITTVAVLLLAAGIWIPPPYNVLPLAAAVIYLFLALRNPEWWLRWLARGCITAGVASAVLPTLVFRQEWYNGFFQFSKTDTHAYLLLLVGVALAVLDVYRERQQRGAASNEVAVCDIRDDPKDRLDDDLRTYFRSAIAAHKSVSLAGFETRVRVPIRLQDLYVPLRAILDRDPRELDSASSSAEARMHIRERGMGQNVPLAEAFRFAQRYGNRNGLVILGDPGSGKTTHLKRILLKIAHDGAASLGLPDGTVPVFLPLRNLSNLERGLDSFIQDELSKPHLVTPEDFGKRLKDRQRVLYLLDGLDEVRDAHQRRQVAAWINSALEASPNSIFVVTCRYAGYTPDARLSPEFLELHIQPLVDGDVDKFVRQWFSIVETSLVDGDERRQAELRADRRANNLLRDLRQPDLQASARVYELTHNPLLLTTICLVHRDRGRLPKRRVDLYEECVSVLLERWNDAKALRTQIPAAEARAILQPLAKWLHEVEGRTRAKEADIAPELNKAIEQTGLLVKPKTFLRSVRDESGLLTGWSVEEYGFMHLGFQEYLASRDVRSAELLGGRAFSALAERFEDSWWQEVILLALAQNEPPLSDRFMRELLSRPDFPALARTQMMEMCLLEAVGVSAGPFVELLQEPLSIVSAERQLAAARILARTIPDALDELGGMLAAHPADIVRRWWAEYRREQDFGLDTITAPRGGVELMPIPGGKFLMGSPRSVGYDDEWPQHEVELSRFYLARTPLTNAQYSEYVRAGRGSPPKYWGDRRYNQPDQPVVGVSWHDAVGYCRWSGLVLPTEAQWEYACRAGTTTLFSFGDDQEALSDYGWYEKNSDGRLHPVAGKQPNQFGLYDMHGGIWEWCEDGFAAYGTPARGGDGRRREPDSASYRILRGGSFRRSADDARSASRVALRPYDHSDAFGFRPAYPF